MAKVWSFNTTIRNPERMENMLRALREMEGVQFDLEGQAQFFGLQIKKRLYKPSRRKLEDNSLVSAVYDVTADDLDDTTVARILEKYKNDPVDAAGRGRTTAGILNRFGLCVAKQAKGPVVITDLGKKWLAGAIDDEEIFVKFLLKWQYPNFIESGYSDFDIKPFVGTLGLITKVNVTWQGMGHKPVGLSKEEYKLFVPSLIKASQIKEYADAIIEYRTRKESKSGKDKMNYVSDFAQLRARHIYGVAADYTKALSDLRDYTDSSLRYFRMSGLIVERGGKTHIDIAAEKQVEVRSVLDHVKVGADHFSSYDEYFQYLGDVHALPLPWKNEKDLHSISIQLEGLLEEEAKDVDFDTTELIAQAHAKPVDKQVDILQESLNEVRIKKLRDLKHNLDVLDDCLEKLNKITSKQYEPLTARPSLDFEWYCTRALAVLNDALMIEPSFKIGDDGIPTGFRANSSDIECLYKDFGMTMEVTLLLGRDQWYAEGQPVMRHLRDFEDKTKNIAYCLFVAPFIHRDTLNSFWGSNKYSYEGRRQNIIPLTIRQFIRILEIAKDKIVSNGLNHSSINELLSSISQGIDKFEDSNEWMNTFNECIDQW